MQQLTRRWRLILGIAVLSIGLIGASSLLSRPVDPEQLLGINLPASASATQSLIVRRFIGEYDGYVRFELAREDVQVLLAEPFFQQTTASNSPYPLLSRASRQRESFASIVQRDRPTWWSPPSGPELLLSYRSRPGPGPAFRGPDAAWYIIDTNDPQRATVYVFLTEV